MSLYHDWKAGRPCLNGSSLHDFERNLGIQILQPAAARTKSVFDEIILSIPRNEQTKFTRALLLAYSGMHPRLREYSNVFESWYSLFAKTDWTDFKKALGKVHLENSMSIDAAKLVLDCTFVLVGERLLDLCKSRMDSMNSLQNPHHNQYINSGDHRKDREQYAAILADFRTRCINEQRGKAVPANGR
jgi:hypothetical protein